MLKPILAALTVCLLYATTPAALAQSATLDAFPYPLVETTGTEAVATWEDLADGTQTPIIVGELRDLERILDAVDPSLGYEPRTPAEIIAAAEALSHPGSLRALREEELLELRAWAAANGYDPSVYPSSVDAPPELVGPWPGPQAPLQAPLSLDDVMTGQPLDTVYITLLPTADPSEAPAYLKFGGWNANPFPEYHVAALRYWRDTYGAVPVVMTSDVIELHVARPPEDQEAAMTLAREQFLYSEDIVTQGVGTISGLGALLIDAPYWFFWWD